MQFESLKVCVIGPIPPPAGGMANQTAELCRLLKSEGANVTLVATNAPYRPAFIARVQGLRALFRLIPYLFQLWRSLARADVAHLMANSGWSWHLFAAPAIWIAHWLKTPLVVNYRGGHAETFFDQAWGWVSPSMNKAKACIVPSGFLAEVFDKRQIPTRIIPNTLDPALFYPAPESEKSGQSPWPVIAITRNLEHIYGIDLALRALPAVLERYPHAKLIVAGSGPEQQPLQMLCEQLEIQNQVEFCGRLSRQQVAELYRSADLLLNPSRVDNSPNSIIEALASGLPVVSTRAGGIPKLVSHNETAYLVEGESPAALADAMLKLLDDPTLRIRLRGNGLQYSERFHWAQVKTDLLDTYQYARERSI